MDGRHGQSPMMVLAGLIGLPDPDIAQLGEVGYAATQLLEGLVERSARRRGCGVDGAHGYLRQFDRAAADPLDNLLGELATACASGGWTLSPRVMMVTLFATAAQVPQRAAGRAVWILATSRYPSNRCARTPSCWGVYQKRLRYEPPFRGHYRHARNAYLGRHGTARGSPALVVEARPAAIQPSSEIPGGRVSILTVREAKAIGFGKGARFCVGAALAAESRSSCVCARRTSVIVGPGRCQQVAAQYLVRRIRLELAVQ